jgi:hypothetical protein
MCARLQRSHADTPDSLNAPTCATHAFVRSWPWRRSRDRQTPAASCPRRALSADWRHTAPAAALAPPSSEAKRHLTCKSSNPIPMKRKIAAEEHPPNASGWMQKARSVIPNMCWYRAKALMPNGRATIEKPAPLAIRGSARAPDDGHPSRAAWGLRWENGQGWHQQQQTPQW